MTRARDNRKATGSRRIVGVLDIGTSKIACLIAAVEPSGMRILGAGLQRAEGVKAGVIIDLDRAEQAARAALDDALIAEIQAHDTIVLGVPMYNFGVSVQLKNWIDAIARVGVTFQYTETGPEGLLKGKKVYIALARGGLYRGTDKDAQVPYLKNVLGFLGMTDLQFIYAEGLAMGPEAAEKGFAQAEADLEAAFA